MYLLEMIHYFTNRLLLTDNDYHDGDDDDVSIDDDNVTLQSFSSKY